MNKRVIWIVLDSVGMGEAPDAEKFGDNGADTLGHIAKNTSLVVPNMVNLGLGNIDGMEAIEGVDKPVGVFARMQEASMGKDTTIGHWEMAGIVSPNPFPTYPNGFPKEIIDEFVAQTGVKGVLGNCTASGTEIIKRLGDEHMKTGYPIVYTSADSVFQIAASEEVYPIDKLYEMCKVARKILTGEHAVARVIARPFIKNADGYTRTSNRRDFSLEPSENNVMVKIKEAGMDVAAVGKIEDIFAGVGVTKALHTKNNQDGIDVTLKYMDEVQSGLIYTNLVEFDMIWGHRRDVNGYCKGLMEFDERLPEIIGAMRDEDVLIITADHGCDPTFKGTDHTREYVPMLMYGKCIKGNVNLGTRKTFADIAATVSDILGVAKCEYGESFWEDVI